MNENTDFDWDLEDQVKTRFRRSAVSNGAVEQLQDRIYELENAVAHLMGFISHRLRLTESEKNDEMGLTDF